MILSGLSAVSPPVCPIGSSSPLDRSAISCECRFLIMTLSSLSAVLPPVCPIDSSSLLDRSAIS